MPHSLSAFYRTLKKDGPKPAYYFYGAEDVLKDEAITALLDQVLDPGLRDFNFDHHSAARLAPEHFGDLCRALPMMAERRVLLVRDVEAWKRRAKTRKVALTYLDNPAPETLLILVQGSAAEKPDPDLTALTYAVDVEPLTPERTRRWVEYRAKHLGMAIEPEAVGHLVDVVGSDLASLLAELNKIWAMAGDKPVTVPMIEDLIGVRFGETTVDWRNAVLEGDTSGALTLLPFVLAQPGVTGVRLVSALGTALVGIALAREHLDRGDRNQVLRRAVFGSLRAARPAGLPGWKQEADRWSRLAPTWSAARLGSAFEAALAADRLLKSTRVSDEAGVVCDLVAQVAPVVQEVG